jgi:hypothetical protein
VDFRIYLQYIEPKNVLSFIEMQSDNMRAVPPFGKKTAMFGCYACREPDFQVGGMMDCDHAKYWGAAGGGEGDPNRMGWKYLKHHWMEVGFAHIANRDGTVRRHSIPPS